MALVAPSSRPPRVITLRLDPRLWWQALAVAGLVGLVWELGQLLLLLLLASFVAVMLHPLSAFLVRRGWRHGWATIAVGIGLLIVLGGTAVALLPPLVRECQGVLVHLPDLRAQALATLDRSPLLHHLTPALSGQHLWPATDQILQRLASLGAWLLDFVVGLVLLLVVAVLMASEVATLWRWFLPYVPPAHRPAADQTAREAAAVIFAYCAGNVLTSIATTVCTYAILRLCHVPAALVLAVLAGIADFVPVVGLIASMVPAALFALTVSPGRALVVILCYLAYHAFETYVLVPIVYGHRMQLSALTVLVALCAGEALGGIPGVILALPVVALYPVIERIWLGRWLGREVVAVHQEILEAAEQGPPGLVQPRSPPTPSA